VPVFANGARTVSAEFGSCGGRLVLTSGAELLVSPNHDPRTVTITLSEEDAPDPPAQWEFVSYRYSVALGGGARGPVFSLTMPRVMKARSGDTRPCTSTPYGRTQIQLERGAVDLDPDYPRDGRSGYRVHGRTPAVFIILHSRC
jgi:hypothetical protein